MTTTTSAPSSTDRSDLPDGRVVAIAGPVVDVEFPPHGLPEINMAVEMDLELDGTKVVVTSEVA
ncbi:MAG TPA: F0F1 ATP synthase subunit beta, partial [Acidimicrobiales bacterium]